MRQQVYWRILHDHALAGCVGTQGSFLNILGSRNWPLKRKNRTAWMKTSLPTNDLGNLTAPMNLIALAPPPFTRSSWPFGYVIMNKLDAKPLNIEGKDAGELRECLELLHAIETIEFHNKNWLANFAIQSPGQANREKRKLIERAIKIIGSSAICLHT